MAQIPDIGEVRAAEGIPLRRVVAALVVFFALAAVLNGSALYEKSSHRAYGPVRDVWLAATAPLNGLATQTGASRLRAFFEALMDHGP